MVIFEDIGFKYGIVVKEANWEVGHVHILFEVKPSTDLVKFINSYKSVSSRIIKKEYPFIKKKRLLPTRFKNPDWRNTKQKSETTQKLWINAS